MACRDVPCSVRNIELSTLCLVIISACVDFLKVKRGLPVKKSIAIKGGGRPTRLLLHAKKLLFLVQKQLLMHVSFDKD